MNEIEKLALALVEACEDIHGGTPDKVIVDPNGEIEVNVRVGYREETHPHVYFIRRDVDV